MITYVFTTRICTVDLLIITVEGSPFDSFFESLSLADRPHFGGNIVPHLGTFVAKAIAAST